MESNEYFYSGQSTTQLLLATLTFQPQQTRL